MSPCPTIIDPAALWHAVRERSASARAAGVLRPITTTQRLIEDGGMRFVVRLAAGLGEKDRASRGKKGQARRNPFLPPHPKLLVGALSASHVAVLNRFPVLEPHLLIVTRAFEPQETALTMADLEALALGLAAIDGLGFYNGGTAAGASQPHKHLQLVPLLLASDGPPIPLAPLLEDAAEDHVPGLPFRHAFRRLDGSVVGTPASAAAAMHAGYRAMLAAMGLGERGLGERGPDQRLPPYNLLATRSWMLLVPRSRESALGISVNGLGFVGSLLVRDAGQLAAVTRMGPMAVLRRVAYERA